MEDKSVTKNKGIEKKVVGRKSGKCDSDKTYDSGERILRIEFKLGNKTMEEK